MNYKMLYGYKVYEDGTVIGKRGQVMSSWDNGRGYQILGIMIAGRRCTVAVHKLVALAFVPNPDDLPEVNHRDTNKLNNHWSNLEWCTRGYNIQHAFENGLRSAAGETNARCKTTEQVVREICSYLAAGHSAAKIRDMGYNYSLVRAIKSRKNWTHISDEYSF